MTNVLAIVYKSNRTERFYSLDLETRVTIFFKEYACVAIK